MPIDKNQLYKLNQGQIQGLDNSREKEQENKLSPSGLDAVQRLKSLPVETLLQLLDAARQKGQSNAETIIMNIIKEKETEKFHRKLENLGVSKDGSSSKFKDPEAQINEILLNSRPEEASTLLEGLDPKFDSDDTRRARILIKAKELSYNVKAGIQETDGTQPFPNPVRFNQPNAKDNYLKRTPTIAQA